MAPRAWLLSLSLLLASAASAAAGSAIERRWAEGAAAISGSSITPTSVSASTVIVRDCFRVPEGGTGIISGPCVSDRTGIGTATPSVLFQVGGGTLAVDGALARVGIGTTSPAYPLDVTGDLRATGQAIVDGSATVKGAGAVRGVLQVGDTGVADAVIHSGDNLTIQIDSNNDGTSNNLQVRRNAATAGGGTLMLNVNENGRMLLGSNDAVTSAQLHVRSDQSPGGGNYVLHISSQDNAGFLTIDQLGNVGYRDTTPDAGLEIVSAVAPTGYVLAVSSQSDVVGGILAVLGDGTIGIGTASPATKLHCSSCTLTIDGNVTASVSVNGTIASSRATDLGWSVVNAANQACNTTCTNACVFGMDTAALGNFLACDNAGSDTCICAGAN